jgi:hypothetical protein
MDHLHALKSFPVRRPALHQFLPQAAVAIKQGG